MLTPTQQARTQRPWVRVTSRFSAPFAGSRYARLVTCLARTGRAAVLPSACEDLSRLAGAVTAVIELHAPDAHERCSECSRGPLPVPWPCSTRQAVIGGLRDGWPPHDLPEPPGDVVEDEPGLYEVFGTAVLELHGVLAAAGGQPARCRACGVPVERCQVWTLATGLLRITPPRTVADA